ncbi:MAG TPA: hypothetical protein VJ203_10790 [Bacteroidales bacterium]|nr:hypothetical protein [Bacteroidales bacterium]
MITKSSISNFNSNGCLTARTIRHYLDGSLKLSDRLVVEEHVRRCRLCSEALRGFKKHQRKNVLRSDMEYLSERVRQQYAGGNQGRAYRMPIIVVVTLVVILVLLVGLFLVLRQYQVNQESSHARPQAVLVIGEQPVEGKQ